MIREIRVVDDGDHARLELNEKNEWIALVLSDGQVRFGKSVTILRVESIALDGEQLRFGNYAVSLDVAAYGGSSAATREAEQFVAALRSCVGRGRARGGSTAGSGAPPVTISRVSAPAGYQRSSGARRRANGAARIVEAAAWISLVLCLIGGVVLATVTTNDEYSDPERPFLGLGLLIAVAGSLQALSLIMVAAYISYRTEYGQNT